MAFKDESKRELTELCADVACSGNATHYETLRKLGVEEQLACTVLRELPDGTPIYPRI